MLRANDWLRLRLIAAVVALLVAGFGITDIINYRSAVSILKSSILHNELPMTGSNNYSEVQADLIRPIFVSSLMANDTFVKDWLLAGEHDERQVVRYLDSIRSKYGVFTSFLISEATRRYYHFRGGDRHVYSDSADDVWYFRARSMTTPYEINIDYDESSDRTVTIFVNYRVLGYDGRFLGITGVGLNVDSVRKIVERYRNNFQRDVYFVTRGGAVTVTSDGGPKSGGNIKDLPGINSVAERILSGSEGQYEYVRDGETYLLDTRFIPELGWYVVVEQRQSDAIKGLWQGFINSLWIGFAIILATATVIAWAVTVYHRRLNLLATTDKLTGLANRQSFDDTMERLGRSGRRGGLRPFAVLLLDIDHFKRINDTLGHLRGDEVIQVIASRTAATLRKSDLVCRWGGEELIMVAYDCDLEEAARLAETLRSTIELAPIRLPDDGTRVTVSVGITVWRDGDTIDRILSRVDRALYQAKRDGRNCVRIAVPPSLATEAAA
jgi:diguanylate cyclase (GGDEF)-like protein